jgi:hypothetical protein
MNRRRLKSVRTLIGGITVPLVIAALFVLLARAVIVWSWGS